MSTVGTFAEFAALALVLAWYGAFFAWVTFGIRTRAVKTVHAEIRPFFIPLAAYMYLIWPPLAFHFGWLTTVEAVLFPVSLINYRAMRHLPGDDDDDRWKRRRRKVAERIAAVAGRLAVIPVGAS